MNVIVVRMCIIAAALTLAVPVRAQLCVGSHIYFIVRDARGHAVDATSRTFAVDGSFTVDGTGRTGQWSVAGRDYFGFAPNMPPELLDALKNKVAPLRASAYCNFRAPATMRITMSGEVQELTLLVPMLGQSESRSFLVDGSPFQAGKFEIAMTMAAPRQYQFYPASGWVKK